MYFEKKRPKVKKHIASRYLLVQNQQWKHQNNVWSLFKFNNKDNTTTSMTSFCCLYCQLWTDFTHFSDVFIVTLNKLNAGWVIFTLITTFNNFALKIEIIWAKLLVKPISETRNVNDVFMPIWFIHSRITNLQRIQCKKGIILNVQNLQRKIKLRQIKSKIRPTSYEHSNINYPNNC